MVDIASRAEVLVRGAAQWRDRGSDVRGKARAALRDSAWSSSVVEAALDDVLADLDEARARVLVDRDGDGRAEARPVLVVLPGNIIGPAIASAYCAAAAGARIILKSAGAERALAPILAAQFDALGAPLAGSIEARYWKGGDTLIEGPIFESVRKLIVFGDDDAAAEIERRSPAPVKVYGTSYSVAFVDADADMQVAALGAARDVAMFDQRGCMSPQTIYVEGDDGRALLFAHALGATLRDVAIDLPRSRISPDEAAALAIAMRDLSVRALAPKTHGLDTLLLGPARDNVPTFVVAVEPCGPPHIEGFGRIVIVKPCSNVDALATIVDDASRDVRFETLGVAGSIAPNACEKLARVFSRICRLGEMQRPSFGYRPTVEDFA